MPHRSFACVWCCMKVCELCALGLLRATSRAVAFLWLFGATIGKKLLGLRVVKADAFTKASLVRRIHSFHIHTLIPHTLIPHTLIPHTLIHSTYTHSFHMHSFHIHSFIPRTLIPHARDASTSVSH